MYACMRVGLEQAEAREERDQCDYKQEKEETDETKQTMGSDGMLHYTALNYSLYCPSVVGARQPALP